MFEPLDLPVYVAAALDLIEAHALHRARLDGSDFRRRYTDLAVGATDLGAAHALLRLALGELGDRHSHLVAPRTSAAPLRQPRPHGRMLADAAYLAVPWFVATAAYDGGDFTADIRRIFADFGSSASGWIVDLRGNGGGDMWPMLTGLAPLLGDGMLGSFVILDERSTGIWSIRAGSACCNGSVMAAGPAAAPIPGPVAILLGPGTLSSGEAVAIAFRDRPLARGFGQPTGGLSTCNSSFELADGTILALTTSVFADRSGRLYGGPVVPDEPVRAAGPDTALDDDPAVLAALAWIRATLLA